MVHPVPERLLPLKLAAPRPSRQPVSRARLSEHLAGSLQTRLVLLSAPPGFGKTTALIDWLTMSRVRSSWLSLDEADNDPARFLRYLWACVRNLETGDIGPIATGGSPADGLEVVDELVTLLAEGAEPSVLVLDDYHLITSRSVHDAVRLLIDRLPSQVHLVIATRADPPMPLARLRARGELLELRADELRFTADEARVFFAERMGLVLSTSDVDTLVARTEGWPAVLQLAGLSLTGRADVPARVQDFAATHRFVLDYITDEVLAGLDDEVREFLSVTSVLDRLTGALCDALTGRSDGQATLERLERDNLLLVPLDEERRWYRYHHLFAELLRARVEMTAPAWPAVLHERAADWYEQQGFAGDAVEHALRSGDDQRAQRLIAGASADRIHAGEFGTLLGWMDRLLDAVVRSDALLSSRYAWALVLAGQTEGVERRLVDAEASLPASVSVGSLEERIPAHIELIRSIAARMRGDPTAAIRHADRALGLVPAAPSAMNDALLADARGILGHALLDVGEVDRAIAAYRAARPVEEQAQNWLAVADITRNLARLEARRGRVQAALEECDAMLGRFADAIEAGMPALAPVYVARAEILGRSGDPGGAATSAERAMELARRGGDVRSLHEARAIRDWAATGRARRPTASGLVEPLTARELEVLALLAVGKSNRQIAAELYLTVGTVKSHVHAISGKLGAANRLEAVAIARHRGLS